MIYYENRIEMLKSLPKNLIIAELGVLSGDFSKQILDICEPSELVLIDTWSGKIGSGDENGNNFTLYDGDLLFNQVTSNFSNNSNVKIIKGKTEKLLDFNNSYFDLIYIDADHSYNGVKKDLMNSYLKIKNGGYITGHDYSINKLKTNNNYDFGVKRAVTEFCQRYDQEIHSLSMDGCVSFSIQIKKF
jgi:hypothetical protein